MPTGTVGERIANMADESLFDRFMRCRNRDFFIQRDCLSAFSSGYRQKSRYRYQAMQTASLAPDFGKKSSILSKIP